jgi:TIR domain
MPFDVFVSYSSKDKPTADAACAALEAGGVRCWIAPRDVTPGRDYGDDLIEALDACRMMVLIFSANANASPQIRREVERCVSRGVPIIPLRIENVSPRRAMAYFIESVHWLDAFTPPLEKHLDRLLIAVRGVLAARLQDPRPKSNSIPSSKREQVEDAPWRPDRPGPALTKVVIIIVVCAIFIILALQRSGYRHRIFSPHPSVYPEMQRR